ncbi:NirA family protein [Sediminicurvatus halobius]|uniref:NirA family protein n=1 Tax=Sediminicurvatus halobius TaxID=2182432 RepID=A0A2U2MZ22_9GAMM|nr:NirA family protein [Spiribacter halobius]PWG61964.1 NirA family protein [Spiribacter halobius]UEX78371.1 NirA family protein [Spiribacter halobius]
MSSKDVTAEFTDVQKRFLEGFLSGIDTLRAGQGLSGIFTPDEADSIGADGHPDALHLAAQAATEKEGRKLVKEELAKREEPALDIWRKIQANAASRTFPQGTDVFRYKFHGLFYTAPNQDAYMCRLRMPNGILTAVQGRGIADLADAFAGGYAHVTTRANLQIREIGAGDAPKVLMGLQDLGIINRGAGADNVRNITGDPLAGADPQALIDTRELCREMHYHILCHRELFGLPRKFNIAFNGGGRVRGVADTNDIDFTAVRRGDGTVWFRVGIGGVPGHDAFAGDTGWLVTPEQCVPLADAILRVYAQTGCRSDRKKARLKYVLESLGMEAFLEQVRAHLDFQPAGDDGACEEAPPPDPMAHVGVHETAEPGVHYIGVPLPFGYLSSEQLRGLAAVAEEHGDALLRLTVWQNLLVAGIPEAGLEDATAAIEALGLRCSASYVRAGTIACTGNFGCKLANADTKTHAGLLVEHLEQHLELDQPLSIHVTGCPNSCAQHKIGDIGLLGTGVETEDEEMVEGYDVFVGGGFGGQRGLGERLFAKVMAPDVPATVERVLRAYQAHRDSPEETFQAFVGRQGVDGVKRLLAAA